MKTSEQIKGLANVTGMTNPMTRPDYREGIRKGMIRDAKAVLLDQVGAPTHIHGTVIGGTLRTIDPKLRALIARKLAERVA